jgi:outer membrane protein OmpA-like peptidoglycan-associated protein
VTVPGEDEHVGLQDVAVVLDASGSMWPGTSFAYAKALTESMVKGFPDGHYGTSLLSYGGEWQFEWTDYPMAPLNREALEAAAAQTRFLAGSTPLESALAYVDQEYLKDTRARAVIVISDGKADRDAVLAQCVEMAYGPVPLCIHTVQVGNDAEGGRLLADMANITPCGSYRHGDSIATDVGMDAFIREVFFAVDSAVIAPEYHALLDKVAGMLKSSDSLFICAAGHTDSTASDSYNMGLAQRRADAVYKALIARGADRDHVFTKAYGEEMPAATNQTRDGRQENRRVELKIID